MSGRRFHKRGSSAQASWVDRIDRMLNDPKATSKRRFDALVTALILLTTAILVSGVYTGDHLPDWLLAVDNLILVFFLFEYLARVALAKPDLPEVLELSTAQWWRYQVQSRIAWMLSPLGIIDLLAITPLFALDESFKLFRVIRVLRLLRLYRFFVYYDPLEKLGRAFRKNSLLYLVAFSFVAITIFMGSMSLYVLEVNENPNMKGPFDAVWWAIVTLTTVGYGDTVPSTDAGRIVAILLMFTGFILMAVFAGVMSQTLVGYLLDVREERVRMSSTVNHVVICGWNSRGHMIAAEIKNLQPEEEVIVFAEGQEPADIPDGVTFLSGDAAKESELEKSRMGTAKSAIVLAPSSGTLSSRDGFTALVVYTLRSFEKKLSEKGIKRSKPLHITAELMDPENYRHLQVAGADEVVHTAQIGSNLVAHTSVKPGMGAVVTELLSWWGHGIDIEEIPDGVITGDTFQKASDAYQAGMPCLVVGLIRKQGKVVFNPPDDHTLLEGDRLVVIREHKENQL